MRSLFALFLFIVAGITASAQLVIDGRQAVWDNSTNTFLATVPDTCFNNSVTMSIATDSLWKDVSINKIIVENTYTFEDISAEKSFTISYIDSTNMKRTAMLQFTFLPIVQLIGEFGYDYEEGHFLLITPDVPGTDTLAASIKWRGGSTNTEGKHKRNYKVKLTKNKSLLGMRNDDSWILDAGQADVFRLRNRVAWDIWNDFAHSPYYIDKEPNARNGISGKVIELFLNDEYRGIYHLSENIDRKQMRLKKVKDGEVHGCLYKVKDYGYGNMNDTVALYDNHSEIWEHIEVKYPDLQDNDSTDWSTLYNALNFVTFSTDEEFEEYVEEYFDLPLLADYCLFASVLNAFDNRGKNTFWAVYDKTQDKKLTLAPWDLDCTTGQEWAVNINGPEFLIDLGIGVTNRLSKNNVMHFNDTLNIRYKQLRKTIFHQDSLINRYSYYYEMVKNSGAAAREQNKWSGDSDVRGEVIDFDNEIKYITFWIRRHLKLLDMVYFPIFKWEEEQSVDHILMHNNTSNTLYTIGGQRIDDNFRLKPGIYIRNGKKIIIRR